MEASSSSSSVAVEPEDFDSHEWVDLDLVEKQELLLRKKVELADFENEVQAYRDAHGWDEDYMERATQDLFYSIRIIDKFQAAINIHLAAGDHHRW